MNTFLRFCRTIHSWLGAIVMPWVLIIGATGLYLNHERFVLNLIDSPGLAADDLANLPQVPLTKEMADQIAAQTWPDQPVENQGQLKYQGKNVYAFKKKSGLIILPSTITKYYIAQTMLGEKYYTVDGSLIKTHYNLEFIFKSLHERGWIGTRFGSLLADGVAFAMVFFALSGFTMWSVPKIRRISRRRSRRPSPGAAG